MSQGSPKILSILVPNKKLWCMYLCENSKEKNMERKWSATGPSILSAIGQQHMILYTISFQINYTWYLSSYMSQLIWSDISMWTMCMSCNVYKCFIYVPSHLYFQIEFKWVWQDRVVFTELQLTCLNCFVFTRSQIEGNQGMWGRSLYSTLCFCR